MNRTNKYHIDVSPEENLLFQDKTKTEEFNAPKTASFLKIFWVVLGIHFIVGAIILVGTLPAKADSQKNDASLTQPVAEIPKKYHGPPELLKPTPSPSPTPSVKKIEKESNQIQFYTVKKGDTITSVAKKYKLRVDRLLSLNNIKDPNKIVVGQKLKFY